MEKYKLIKSAFFIFREKLGIDDDYRIDILKRNELFNSQLELSILREELEELFKKKGFDWFHFVQGYELYSPDTYYDNNEIKNYVKYIFYDFIYPEKSLDIEGLEKLRLDIVEILKREQFKDKWLYSYDLYRILKQGDCYQNLEYYHLFQVIPFLIDVERKFIPNKYREIGYFKLKSNE